MCPGVNYFIRKYAANCGDALSRDASSQNANAPAIMHRPGPGNEIYGAGAAYNASAPASRGGLVVGSRGERRRVIHAKQKDRERKRDMTERYTKGREKTQEGEREKYRYERERYRKKRGETPENEREEETREKKTQE